ncbi:MAG TPA: hypothetical protein DEB74_05985 [Lachnospiraceae bacterium]|nr:hypothetical protein [Lachnospiraceae bacterium]
MRDENKDTVSDSVETKDTTTSDTEQYKGTDSWKEKYDILLDESKKLQENIESLNGEIEKLKSENLKNAVHSDLSNKGSDDVFETALLQLTGGR